MIIFRDAHDYLGNLTSSPYESDMQVRLIGHSPSMEQLRSTIGKVANSYVSALTTGESDSGKEVMAFAIHQSSPCKITPFVAINCAAIPKQLLENELSGYVRGAFSGADPKGRMGKFELVNGGSLLLDGIGDMPLHLQAKLPRVLQEKTITRVGSNNTINTDVRIVVMTNKNINAAVENNQFCEDLFYCLNVVPPVLPSLCERRADIVVLAQYLVDEFSVSYQRPPQKLHDDVINRLYAWHWSDNIREPYNVIEYTFVMHGEAAGTNASHLPPYLLTAADGKKTTTAT